MHNRAQNVAGWRDDEFFLILLRQFKRLLAEHGADLSDAQLRVTADQIAARQVDEADAAQLCNALVAVVEESLALLNGWNLSYAQSLATGMDEMPGWETTADFLALANEKGNAELRISTGAALLIALGDGRYAGHLLACYQHGADDPEDVDAVIARRALSFAASIPLDVGNWLSQIERWIAFRIKSH